MANKTAEKISPDTFLNEMNAINNKAKDAVIDLLNKQGDNRYIVVMDWKILILNTTPIKQPYLYQYLV